MTVMNEDESAMSAHGCPFGCPTTRSRLFGARRCNLLIVINEFFERQSFDELADGKVLYSKRYEVGENRSAWKGPEDLEFVGRSIVASAKGSKAMLNYDEEIIRFGERAHAAFPDIPLLGFDIVRQLPSGKLFVLEANAIGYVWAFNSTHDTDFGFSAEHQFDGVRKAAYILAEKTQELAR